MPATDAALARAGSLGLVQGTAPYIAAVLGTGILALPGLAGTAAGPASLVAVFVVPLLSIPLASTFAALAARYPDPGGVASYVRRALGPTWARTTGYSFFFGVGTAISLFVWAFAGREVGTHIAAEFTNPGGVTPLATAVALVLVGIAYLALQYVTVAVLGRAAGRGQVAPLDLVATNAPGVGPVFVAVIAAVAAVGVLNVYLGAFILIHTSSMVAIMCSA